MENRNYVRFFPVILITKQKRKRKRRYIHGPRLKSITELLHIAFRIPPAVYITFLQASRAGFLPA